MALRLRDDHSAVTVGFGLNAELLFFPNSTQSCGMGDTVRTHAVVNRLRCGIREVGATDADIDDLNRNLKNIAAAVKKLEESSKDSSKDD